MVKTHGVSGNRPIYGQIESGDHVRTLYGPSSRSAYEKMRRDGQVKAVLRAMKLPIQRTAFSIDAASDDARDVEVAEFVENNLHKRMTMTWSDTLRHILLQCDFGFSIFEPLWMRSDDGLIRLKKMDPRLPQSINAWYYNGDHLDYVEQFGADGKLYKLPIDKIVVFTENREGDNWEGESVLRSAYGYWKIKQEMLRIAAIKHDRWGLGIPKGTHPTGAAKEDIDAFTELLKDLHANEEGYLEFPEGWSADVLTSKNGPDTEGFIKQLDEMIARSALAQFLSLGSSETGSRALGESFQRFFLDSLNERAAYIADVMTRFVIRKLVAYNFEVDDYPVMRAAELQQLDADAVERLVNAGVITPDDNLEASVRDVLRLPEKMKTDEAAPADVTTEDPEGEPEPEPEADEDQGEPDDMPEETEASHEHPAPWEFADRTPVVPRNDTERLVRFERIEMTLDQSIERAKQDMLEIRDRQVDKIINELVAGRAIERISVPGKAEMQSDLLKTYKTMLAEGQRQVREEVRRQRPDIKAQDVSEVEQLVEYFSEKLSIMVEGAANKLKTMLAEIALDLRARGFTGQQLKIEMDDWVSRNLSDRTWVDLAANATNGGWGDGRRVAMEDYADEIQYVYRSGLLDRNNICEVCEPKNGVTFELGDPEYRAPDAQCKGGVGRCRCVNVAVMKAEGE